MKTIYELLTRAANQVREGIRVDVDELRDAGLRRVATLIEDQIDDSTTAETRARVIAEIEAARE